MLWQLCLVLVAIYALVLWWKNKPFRNIYKQIPCSLPTVPILGHAINFLGDAEDRMLKIHQLGRDAVNKTGVTSLWLANKFYVVIADPVAVDVVAKNCLEKDEMMNIAKPLIGNGSIFAPVSIWRPRRKVLAPTFGQKTLNSFVKIFAKQSAVMAEQLKSKSGKDHFSIFDHITTYSLDSVCETTLGVEVNAQNNPNHPVLKAFVKFCNICAIRAVRPWTWSEAVFKCMPNYSPFIGSAKVLINFVDKIIKSKREKFKQQQKKNVESKNNYDENSHMKTFLELLIESSGGEKGYSDLELQEETLVMVLAGTDTSALGASFTSLLLAKYPDVQEKVFEEIQEVLGGSDRPIEAEDLPKLKYLDAVIKESLRMYPPVPLTVRTVETNISLPSGVTLVPGVGIIMHIWAIHRNPKYWGPDVNVFRPERFFDSPPTHPAAYIPFNYGPRMCLGYQYASMSMKTAIATLVRRYRLLPRIDFSEDETYLQDKKEPLRTKFEVMTRHINNFELRVEDRN